MKEYWIFRGEVTGFLGATGTFLPDPNSLFLVHRGPENNFVDSVPVPNKEYFYRIAAIDEFGPDKWAVSAEISSKVGDPGDYVLLPCPECCPYPGWPRTPAEFVVRFDNVKRCNPITGESEYSDLNGQWTFRPLPEHSCVWWKKAIIDGYPTLMFLDLRVDIVLRPNTTRLWVDQDLGGSNGALFDSGNLARCTVEAQWQANYWGVGDCGAHPERPADSITGYDGTAGWTPGMGDIVAWPD